MKKVYYIIIIICIFSLRLNAQQISYLCNGDSAILVLPNYSGTIQWEQSPDTINWTQISGATNDSLKINANTNSYFRATITDSANICYSYIKHFVSESIPIASAGYDLDVNDSITYLEASSPGYGIGSWSVIAGTGGVIVSPFDSVSMFRGYYDSTYTLVWTVTNSCGSASDTVNVKFNHLIINNKVIVIDTINHLISDSSQLSNGIYVIAFNSTIPVITDSSIIVGKAGAGYLRKVTGFSQSANVITFQTLQATLEDALNSGAIRFLVDNNNMDSVALKKGVLTHNKINYLANGVNINKGTKDSDGFQYDFNNVTLYQNGPLTLSIPSGSVKFNPNFVFDANVGLFTGLNKFYFYTNNAVLKNTINVQLTATQAIQLANIDKTLAEYTKTVNFLVGPLPVIAVINTKLNSHFTADIDATVIANTSLINTNTLSLGVKYENEQWAKVFNASTDVTMTPVTMTGTVNVQLRLEVVPEISVKLYNVIGPYIKPMFYEQYNGSITSPSLDWNASFVAGLNTTAGANIEVLKKTISDYSFDVPLSFTKKWEAPSSIEIVSGNNQSASAGDPLPEPLVVKVKDNLGNPSKIVPVYYTIQSGDGSVNPISNPTTSNGTSQTNWTLQDSTNNTLKAYIKKANGTIINSTLFSATATNLSITPDSVTLGKNAGNFTFQVKSNTAWSVSSNQSWLSLSPSNGTGNSNVIATFTENLSGADRQAIITLSSTGFQSQTALLIQKSIITQPYSIEVFSGNNQVGVYGQKLTNQITVIVKDQYGNPYSGALVYFTANNGSSVSQPYNITGSDGKTSVLWTLGNSENSQTVTVTGSTTLIGAPLTFTATAKTVLELLTSKTWTVYYCNTGNWCVTDPQIYTYTFYTNNTYYQYFCGTGYDMNYTLSGTTLTTTGPAGDGVVLITNISDTELDLSPLGGTFTYYCH